MDKAELEFEWQLNSPEAKAEANAIEKALDEVGDAGENAEKRVQAAIQKTASIQREQIGIIERLKQKVAEFKDAKEKAMSTTSIEKYNIKIQQFEKEIDRLNKIGKQGFDEMGKAIPDFEKPIGQINRLRYAQELYSKAASSTNNTEVLAKYNRKIVETQKEIERLKNLGKDGFDELGNKIETANKQTGGFMTTLKGLAATIGITFSLGAIVQWGKELFGIANKASGIERAFSAIGGSDALEKLRRETKGFVNDLELEKLTVQAKNLNVPIDNLGTYLAFAAQRAKDGQGEVQQLTNDIINGLGRESPRVIDNLGISQKELNKEIAKTGDFSQAVANIMKRSMNEAGVAVDTLADQTNRLATWWENLKKKLSDNIAGMWDGTLADNRTIGNITANTMKHYADFDKQTEARREKTLTNYKAYIQKLSDNYVQSQKVVKSFGKENKNFTGEDVGKAMDAAKFAGEKLAAAQNVLKNLQETNRRQSKTERQDRGVYNINELDEKIDNLTLKFKDTLDPAQRANLKKQIDEATKLRDQMEGKEKKVKGAKSEESQLNAQRVLQQKITDIQNEYARKSKTQDDAEVQAVRDKFSKIAKEVQAFNKNPKNKYKVDGSGLTNTMNTAIDDLKYRQETEAMKISIERQKQLYQQFEEYKLVFGEEKAKERYKNEIDVNSTYLAQAQKQFALAFAQNTLSGGRAITSERLTFAGNNLSNAEAADKDRYTKLLAELMSYEEKRLLLTANYEIKRKELVEKGATNQITVLDKIHKDALGKLDDENIAKLDAYKRLFEGVEELSDEAAKKVIADAQLMLDKLVRAGTISSDLAKQITDKLRDTTKALDARLPAKLKNLGGELRNIAGLVGDVNFSGWLTDIGSVIGNIGQAKEQIASLKNLKSGDVMGAVSGGLGLFSTFMGIGEALGGIFNRAGAAKNAQAAYANELQMKQTEALTRALDQQLELINKVYGTEKLTKYAEAMQEIASQTDRAKSQLSGLYQLTGDKSLDKIITKMNNGQSLAGYEEAIANQIKKDGRIGIKIPLNDLKELQRLLDEGKLDERAAKLAQTLIDLNKKAGEVSGATTEELTGTSFTSLADSLMQAITSGAEDGAKNFEDIMRNAMLNSLRSKELTSQIQKFYDDFADANKDGGLDEAKIAALRAQYEKIIADGKAAAANLEKVTGISLNDKDAAKNDKNTIRGNVENITAQQADVLSGNIAGMRLAIIDLIRRFEGSSSSQMADLKSQLLYIQQIAANTERTADNTENLKDIKKSLESMDKKMSSASNGLKALGG